MAIRTEQTLRRMWDESTLLFQKAADAFADADEQAKAAFDHERAAAAEAAAAAVAAHGAENAKRTVGKGQENEAADLADLVNRERQDAGLSPLAPGEAYPADPAPVEQPTPEDALVASGQSSTVTRTDGEVTK